MHGEPPPIVAPSLGVRVGPVIARDTLFRGDQTSAAYADWSLGPGFAAEIDAGARFFGMATLFAFGERAWFTCGSFNSWCNGTSTSFGLGLRAEPPHGRMRPFFELGIAHRRLDAVVPAFVSGTSASVTYQQREPYVAPPDQLYGLDLRIAAGVTFRVSSTLSLEGLGQLSVGKFKNWSGLRRSQSSLDPNAPRSTTDDLPEDQRAMHAFVGFSLGARWIPR